VLERGRRENEGVPVLDASAAAIRERDQTAPVATLQRVIDSRLLRRVRDGGPVGQRHVHDAPERHNLDLQGSKPPLAVVWVYPVSPLIQAQTFWCPEYPCLDQITRNRPR
jgi:hypothetical protein